MYTVYSDDGHLIRSQALQSQRVVHVIAWSAAKGTLVCRALKCLHHGELLGLGIDRECLDVCGS